MRFKIVASILTIALLSTATVSAKDDNDKKREKTRKMAAQTLQEKSDQATSQDHHHLGPHRHGARRASGAAPCGDSGGNAERSGVQQSLLRYLLDRGC